MTPRIIALSSDALKHRGVEIEIGDHVICRRQTAVWWSFAVAVGLLPRPKGDQPRQWLPLFSGARARMQARAACDTVRTFDSRYTDAYHAPQHVECRSVYSSQWRR